MARKYKDKSLHDKNLVKKSDFFNPPCPPLKGGGYSFGHSHSEGVGKIQQHTAFISNKYRMLLKYNQLQSNHYTP